LLGPTGKNWLPGPIILMGDQPCASGRSTLPPGNTREAKPPKKRCLLAPRWDYPEGTPNGSSTTPPSAPPPVAAGLKSLPPPEKWNRIFPALPGQILSFFFFLIWDIQALWNSLFIFPYPLAPFSVFFPPQFQNMQTLNSSLTRYAWVKW
jgi:hypothetical protein